MKGSDISIMIYKLQSLNMYIEKDIEQIKEDIEYWEEQVKEFGEDEVIMSNTYGEVLKITNKQLEFKLKELKENYRLIDVLTNKIENIYQV